MATIADTLNDIQRIQAAMSARVSDVRGGADGGFIRDLMNFTTVYFFGLLSHTALDALRDCRRVIRHPYADKYYSMYSQPGLLLEVIRFDNVSGMFLLWNIFEQYIDRTRVAVPGDRERTLEDRYKRILRHIGICKLSYDEMVNEFNLIRRTRNSLHGGGVYRNSRSFSCMLKGRRYSLEMGKKVTPIRTIDVAEIMWEHFLAISNGLESSLVASK